MDCVLLCNYFSCTRAKKNSLLVGGVFQSASRKSDTTKLVREAIEDCLETRLHVHKAERALSYVFSGKGDFNELTLRRYEPLPQCQRHSPCNLRCSTVTRAGTRSSIRDVSQRQTDGCAEPLTQVWDHDCICMKGEPTKRMEK